MAKKRAHKNKNSRLRRTVLGTLSAVFMISAIIVAMVPVRQVEAVTDVDEWSHVVTADPNSIIPAYTSAPVFSSADALFRVAYVNRTGSTSMEGVLVYYDGDSSLAPASLIIPDSISAYQLDSENRMCAVSGDQEYLYYISQEQEVDVSGNTITPQVISPALASNTGDWSGKPLYVSTDGINLSVQKEQLSIDVRYIGSQKFTPSLSSPTGGSYEAEGTGVFENARNFSSVTIPDHILAIGNNAFEGCQMRSVALGGKVHSIGNFAFSGCNQLGSVSFSAETNLEEIGAHAFADCTYLSSISVPDQVIKIGDCCFRNDTALSAVNIYGTNSDGNTSLETLGDGVFYGCTALGQMYLPRKLSNIDTVNYLFYDCSSLNYLSFPISSGTSDKTFNANNVTGCSGLLTVSVPNRDLKFDCDCALSSSHKLGDGENCAFGKKNLGCHTPFPDEFEVDDRFCIMSYRNSEAYTYACDHEYSVGYLDAGYEGQFERVKGNYFYCVNENNELIKFSVANASADSSIVDIPDNIGSHHISAIGSSTFQNNNNIKYVHIPASVTSIAESAFKGCHNLSEVEFADAMSIESIGADAFRTETTSAEDADLRFVGTIGTSCEPYIYAMNPDNNYNASSLPTKYISYTSAFPSNLQVELDVETDPLTNALVSAVPTLVSAPTYEQFKNGDYSLSTYPDKKDEQNAIVSSAYTKYHDMTVNGNDGVVFSEDEQAVLDAVFKATVPYGVDALKDDVYKGNEAITSVILNSVTHVPDEAFAGCTALETFIMRSSGKDGGESLGDKVFLDDDALTTVSLPSTLTQLGSLPFYKDSNLSSVTFNDNPLFTCENAIIYALDSEGKKVEVIECLETRGNTVGTGKIREEELADVTKVAPHAFENCTGVTQVYFGDAALDEIPDYCFSGCTKLNYCEVSPLTKSIGDYAFQNTSLSDIRIPTGTQMIAENAFVTTDELGVDSLIRGLNIQCEENSPAYVYAVKFGFGTEDRILHKYTVKFYNFDGSTLLDTQLVEEGSDAVPPEAPAREGYTFTQWLPNYTDVSADLSVYPQYTTAADDGGGGSGGGDTGDTATYHSVTFYNFDGSMKISIQRVVDGGAATEPATVPERDGYTFTGWLPEFSNVISDLDIYPQYKSNGTSGDDNNGGDNNNNGSGDNGTNNNGTDNNTNNNGTTATPNTNNTTTNNTTNTAKPGTSTTTNKGTVSGNGSGTSNKNNTTTNKGSGNSTVSVDKSGISNSNLVSASVNGSSDDYVVKITDSETAKSAVEQALLNEYGSLDAIRYFAMDISLYDKTGTTKIQNTDGISVTVTMPLPDALASYAGNNKVGAVASSGALEKLQARFTTINNVPCVSFVATHFSPYTIYVDLNDMSAAGSIDATPVTGDPIHPKWFLAMGLAILSVFLFAMKGSKRKVVKVIS